MRVEDIPAVVALQKAAFPPPFSEDLHWKPAHLARHLEVFPDAQWVADLEGRLVGSCSNTLVSEDAWSAHASWIETVGGPCLDTFCPSGSTLYGLDITVHPSVQRQGIGRAFYERRFALVREMKLARYGTGCRIPDYKAYAANHPGVSVEEYARMVERREAKDRTLTPLLRMGLSLTGVVEGYMEDEESDDSAALLEWKP
jgi:GNAT superfamily N-acetyltransferase